MDGLPSMGMVTSRLIEHSLDRIHTRLETGMCANVTSLIKCSMGSDMVHMLIDHTSILELPILAYYAREGSEIN